MTTTEYSQDIYTIECEGDGSTHPRHIIAVSFDEDEVRERAQNAGAFHDEHAGIWVCDEMYQEHMDDMINDEMMYVDLGWIREDERDCFDA